MWLNSHIPPSIFSPSNPFGLKVLSSHFCRCVGGSSDRNREVANALGPSFLIRDEDPHRSLACFTISGSRPPGPLTDRSSISGFVRRILFRTDHLSARPSTVKS